MFKIVTGTFGVKVVSDEGFEVSLTSSGCDGLFVIYSEGEQSLFLDAFQDRSEPKGKNRKVFVQVPPHLKWSELKDSDFMTESEAFRILENIQDALEFQDKSFKRLLVFLGSPLAKAFYQK